MTAFDAPAALLDRAVEEAREALGEIPPNAEDTRITSLIRCAKALRSLLAALDADRVAAEAALREISVECTEPPFMGDGSLVSARRIKGMCDRYFARREGEKGENRG